MRTLRIASILLWAVVSGERCRADDAPFNRRLSVTATAMNEEVVETLWAEDIVIRSQSAIGMFGQITISISDYSYDFEILNAATIKADGRELQVPSEKILLSSLPMAAQLGIFQADVRIRTIVFPDVSVGDSIHYKMRYRVKQPAIPGGFSMVRTFPSSGRYEAVSIVLDSPKTIQIADASSGFLRKVEESEDRRKVSWTLAPQSYQADEPRAIASVDRDPYVAYSSFPNWEAIGLEFLQQAAPMSAPTPELLQLANNITQGLTDRREQARAIFDWVSTKIRYLAIFLGNGAFVPHEAATVLANKFGDCKDHTTLMRALLATKGMEADYVFISLDPTYSDPKIPATSWFNHVILWLPEFGLYVDPTATHATFSTLPDGEADKVVLRVGSSGVTLARTAALRADNNQMTVNVDVTILQDGTATGMSTVTASGSLGIQLRSLMADGALKGGQELAKSLLASQNWRGSGNIELREATDHTEPFSVRTHFTLANKFLDEDGNRNPVPVGPRLVPPVWLPYYDSNKNQRTQSFVCQSASYQQQIDLHFPARRRVINVPAQLTISNPQALYEASYQLTDQGLHISRRLVITVPHQSCSPAVAADIAPVIDAAVKDFGWRPQFEHQPG